LISKIDPPPSPQTGEHLRDTQVAEHPPSLFLLHMRPRPSLLTRCLNDAHGPCVSPASRNPMGGGAGDLHSMEQIRQILRPTDVPDSGLICARGAAVHPFTNRGRRSHSGVPTFFDTFPAPFSLSKVKHYTVVNTILNI